MHIPASKAVGFAAAVLVSSGAAFVVTGGTAVAACGADAYVISAPTDGATVSGTVPLAANRSTTGYGGSNAVSFSVDGVAVSSTTTTTGLSASWDSSTVSDGTHAITVAYAGGGSGGCTAGDPASAAVNVTVKNGNVTPTVDVKTLTTDSSGTATATSTNTDNETLTTTIKGAGSATIGWYSGAPTDAPSTSTGSYFDIKVPSASALSEITLVVDVSSGTNSAFFLDPKTNTWAPVIGGTVENGKLTVTITNSTVPSIADLTGTVFSATAVKSGDISAACNTAGGTAFSDMTKDVHAASARCLAAYGVASGVSTGKFGPTLKVTRAQVAEFLARLLTKAGVTLPAPGSTFTDVKSTDAHANAINSLAKLDVIKGVTKTTFNPSGAVTRAQMASLLVRAYELAAGMTVPTGTVTFADVKSTDAHAGDIAKLVTLGVTQGITSTKFGPGNSVLRDQMATFLARQLDLLVLDGKVALKR